MLSCGSSRGRAIPSDTDRGVLIGRKTRSFYRKHSSYAPPWAPSRLTWALLCFGIRLCLAALFSWAFELRGAPCESTCKGRGCAVHGLTDEVWLLALGFSFYVVFFVCSRCAQNVVPNPSSPGPRETTRVASPSCLAHGRRHARVALCQEAAI